jgi:hypothetical protein
MYFRDYPACVVGYAIGNCFVHTLFSLPFMGLPTTGIVLYTILTFTDSIFYLPLAFLNLVLAHYFIKCYLTGLEECFMWKIIPCFESRLDYNGKFKNDPFFNGYELAKHCRLLDEFAASQGNATVSQFGFYDSSKLVWFNTTDFIPTLLAFQRHPAEWFTPELKNDISILLRALLVAEEKKIGFCLLVRTGKDNLICPKEIESYKGSFW